MNQFKPDDLCIIKQVHISDSYFPYNSMFRHVLVRVVNVEAESQGFVVARVELREDVEGFIRKGQTVFFKGGVQLEKAE